MPKVVALNPSWNYSWGSQRVETQPDDIEFVPMIWGAWNEDKLNQAIQTDIVPYVASGKVKRVLGFNEPDNSNQSDMLVENAIAFWPALESIGLPLASPSAARIQGNWMEEFMSQADSPSSRLRVEYVAMHWYWGPDPETFKQKLRHTFERYDQRPILLTEFAVADWSATTVEENRYSRGKVLDFMKNVIPWLEAQEWIVGYAWFSFPESSVAGTSSALYDSYGSLTTLGRFYASVNPNNPYGDQDIL